MRDEDWIDPYLAHLRTQGASDRTLIRYASRLGRIAARGVRTRAELATVVAFWQWVQAHREGRLEVFAGAPPIAKGGTGAGPSPQIDHIIGVPVGDDSVRRAGGEPHGRWSDQPVR